MISVFGLVLLLLLDPCAAFITAPKSALKNWPRCTQPLRLSNGDEQAANKKELKSNNPLELAAWYGVEAFGKVFRQSKSPNSSAGTGDIDLTQPPSSMKETFARIQLDNDRYYFLSGDVDRLIYDEDCVFADPFVSFNGKVILDTLRWSIISLSYYSMQRLIITFSHSHNISGRDRFIDNLSNLGSFITNYDVKMINYGADNVANEVNMKVSMKL